MAKILKNTEHKIVHLDLKGAPPKVGYLEEIIPQFHLWGATGLLIEYEDMFPYEGEISEISAPDAYSRDDVERILQIAAENDMIVIPLVQTFGHLEFVLKHEKFRTLREVPSYPMALCPSNENSLLAVKMMIDQVMSVHGNQQFFHIGADEVYHIGVCEKCKARIRLENLTPQELFFKHVKEVVSYIKEKYPSLTIIMWDDMLRSADLALLKDSGLSEIVEPMVWHYVKSFMLPPDIWQRFSSVFPTIWFASAFKGATGSSICVTNISYHIENHLAWLSVQENVKSLFKKIRGFAITGWQRYDHYAVLCELLPQALPSLGIMLGILSKGTFCEEIHSSVSKDLTFCHPYH
ncbi:hypothetical protein FSP39_005156 [Pinctada imbricata]|uniref:beta-N-acetylhexosaminidase n=1 Tax=Pinctada imbricata TaxID=66713 RepID=A0AA88XMH7_PINIB|nr:hypothetical protein FSP39_005156 [Pinctada imbricata]